jgi:quercetin dioxygenase-like cupin family protein
MRKLRRIVTGHNAQGKSSLVFDGPPPTVTLGGRLAEIWYTDETPASNRGHADASLRPLRMEPPARGSVFRCLELDPESRIADLDAAARTALMRETLANLSAEHVAVDTTRHPGMHRTRSIDYVVVLAGKVTMLLDEGEVDLEPFDMVVQRGTNHAWINRGTEPVLLLAVMLDAERL